MQNFSADKTYAVFLNAANKKIIADLEAIGAKTILFPSLEMRGISAPDEDLTSILPNFDWLIFTDIYTVEFFLQKLRESDFDFYNLDEIRICAYGESVADYLRFDQIHADIIPNNVKTNEVFKAINDYFLDEEELKNNRFLIFKESKAQSEITGKLEEIGAKAAEISIYETVFEKESETAKLRSLLVGGAIDEFIFTTPFDVIHLAHLFPNENLTEVLQDVKLNAKDKTVSQSLEEFRINLS